MQTEIGIATINYKESGLVASASFQPTMKIQTSNELLKQFISAEESNKQESLILKNAQIVFASWWNKINEIELADREQQELVSEIVSCIKFNNGTVKTCAIKFFLKDIENNSGEE